jgi:iron complex outermembrane receptor protein
MKTSTATRLLALTACLAFALSARAQLAPAPSAALSAPPSEKDKEVVKLNVFQVVADNDDEYRAANTTSGTRYSTPIKDLPFAISAFTQHGQD